MSQLKTSPLSVYTWSVYDLLGTVTSWYLQQGSKWPNVARNAQYNLESYNLIAKTKADTSHKKKTSCATRHIKNIWKKNQGLLKNSFSVPGITVVALCLFGEASCVVVQCCCVAPCRSVLSSEFMCRKHNKLCLRNGTFALKAGGELRTLPPSTLIKYFNTQGRSGNTLHASQHPMAVSTKALTMVTLCSSHQYCAHWRLLDRVAKSLEILLTFQNFWQQTLPEHEP